MDSASRKINQSDHEPFSIMYNYPRRRDCQYDGFFLWTSCTIIFVFCLFVISVSFAAYKKCRTRSNENVSAISTGNVVGLSYKHHVPRNNRLPRGQFIEYGRGCLESVVEVDEISHGSVEI